MPSGLCFSLPNGCFLNPTFSCPNRSICATSSFTSRRFQRRPSMFKPLKRIQYMSQKSADQLVFVEDPQRPNRLLGPGNENVSLPVLLYIAGLDAKPLPENQCEKLREHYAIVSLCHATADQSDWDCLVRSALPNIELLRSNATGITLVGESFGAAFALRLVAASPQNTFERLVLLNSGTALARQPVLRAFTNLLPILRIDRTERVLYKAAAIILFKAFLTREDRLDDRNLPSGPPALRSIDIDSIPIQTMCHRVKLLREFESTFPDSCMKLVNVPTTIIASQNDRLLDSSKEAARLQGLLPDTTRVVTLESCEHAALWEKDVNLSDVLASDRRNDQKGSSSARTAKNTPAKHTLKAEHLLEKQYGYTNAIAEGRRLFEPWRRAISPKVMGKENVENALKIADDGGMKRPILFVGNHGMLGIMDTSLVFMEILDLLDGERLRPLADQIHFGLYSKISNGRWDNFITTLGAVKASPMNFYRLLAARDRILLFPGGAREVCRRRGERNLIFWDEKLDFLRPASKFNALIVPFSAVGADDAVNLVLDGQELQTLPFLGPGFRRFLENNELSVANVMPLTTILPRLDRFYFKFHEPIDTESVDSSDVNACREVYRGVKKVVEIGINQLIEERERDPHRTWQSRTTHRLVTGAKNISNPKEALKSFLDILPGFDL